MFFITATVDVVLGPLLSLVVFSPSKSRPVIAKDLGVILLPRTVR